MGWFDLGSSAMQNFKSFSSCVFLFLLSQNLSVFAGGVLLPVMLLLLHLVCWLGFFSPIQHNWVVPGLSSQYIIRFTHSTFVFSICGNTGCSCYSNAVLGEWAQHMLLRGLFVLYFEVWILCCAVTATVPCQVLMYRWNCTWHSVGNLYWAKR